MPLSQGSPRSSPSVGAPIQRERVLDLRCYLTLEGILHPQFQGSRNPDGEFCGHRDRVKYTPQVQKASYRPPFSHPPPLVLGLRCGTDIPVRWLYRERKSQTDKAAVRSEPVSLTQSSHAHACRNHHSTTGRASAR